MAPEYIDKGLISAKADIFSLGVIIMELMTGSRDYPWGSEADSRHFVETVRWIILAQPFAYIYLLKKKKKKNTFLKTITTAAIFRWPGTGGAGWRRQSSCTPPWMRPSNRLTNAFQQDLGVSTLTRRQGLPYGMWSRCLMQWRVRSRVPARAKRHRSARRRRLPPPPPRPPCNLPWSPPCASYTLEPWHLTYIYCYHCFLCEETGEVWSPTYYILRTRRIARAFVRLVLKIQKFTYRCILT